MKKFNNVAIVLFLLVFAVNTFASSKTSCTYEDIENNLIVGVKSDNAGLRISSAYYLGEIKSEKSVIALMKILKSSSNEEERIMAALSLTKINSELGNFAVQRRAIFDDSQRVRRLCNIFYKKIKQVNNTKTEVTVEPIKLSNIQNYLDKF